MVLVVHELPPPHMSFGPPGHCASPLQSSRMDSLAPDVQEDLSGKSVLNWTCGILNFVCFSSQLQWEAGVNRARGPSTPRWVKVFGMVALFVVVLFVVMHFAGMGFGQHVHEAG